MVTELPESTYYYHLSNKDVELEKIIQDIFKESKETYGYRRIKEKLEDIGLKVNQDDIILIKAQWVILLKIE